ELELGCVVARHPGRSGDLNPVGGDALGVLAGVGVAGLDGVGQRTHSGAVGAGQLLGERALLLERVAQIGGVALELQLLVGSLALTASQLSAKPRDLSREL